MNNNFNFINDLKVFFNKKEVGRLKIDGEIVYFQYHPDWVKDGFSISPFNLPLNDSVFEFKNKNLPIWGVFIDCLPDGWGIRLNIKKCAQYGINYQKLNILEKLSLTDKTGLGGFDFVKSNAIKYKIEFNLEKIVDDVIENYKDISNLKMIDEIYQQANSSGGARPKIHYKDKSGSWIIKLPMSRDDLNVGVKEYEANMLSKECGININECKLIRLQSGIQLFAAKRFDINRNVKNHTISVAGLLDLDFRIAQLDYLNIFEIINMLSIDKQNDFYDFFTRMVFNYKFGNCDDHIKNISFIYDEQMKGYRLSPAFDTTHTPELKFHNLLCNGKDVPTDDDFLEISERFNLNMKKCKSIILKVDKIVNSYKKLAY